NGLADFIRFTTADRVVGNMHTDFQKFDLDWMRPMKRLRRFSLDSRLGLRLASLNQEMDLAYRELGSFAVYSDTEGAAGQSERTTVPTCPRINNVVDGDGDGETQVANNEADGDGFMDG